MEKAYIRTMTYQILAMDRNRMRKQIDRATDAGYPHYVYGLLRGDTNNLFYVGKGTNGRVFDHEAPRAKNLLGSRHKKHIIEKYGVQGYVFFGAFDSHGSAIEFERELILYYGIERYGGKLTNDTLGGDGLDPETASLVAKTAWEDPDSGLRKFWDSPEAKEKMRGNIENARKAFDPEKHSLLVKGLWRDSTWRETHSKSIYEFWNSEEGEKLRDIKSRNWVENQPMHDPAVREKVSASMKEYSKRPEVTEKRREAALKHKIAQRPEVRKKISEAARNRDRSRLACARLEWKGRTRRFPELCEELGVKPDIVRYYAREKGYDLKKALEYVLSTTPEERKQRAHAAQVEAARQKRLKERTLYVNGESMTLNAASKRIGRANSSIRSYAQRHDITLQQAIDYYVKKKK